MSVKPLGGDVIGRVSPMRDFKILLKIRIDF